MRQEKRPLLGLSVLLGATFVYGFMGILSRISGFNLPFFYQNWVRSLLAALISAVLIIFGHQWRSIGRKDFPWILARGVAGIIAFMAFFTAVNYLPIGTTYFVFFIGSVLSGYLLGFTLFHEQFTRIKLFSLILASVGLIIMYQSDLRFSNGLYVAIAAISGCATAVWNTFSKKVSGEYAPALLSCIDNIIAFSITFVLSLAFREVWVLPTVSAVWGANILLSGSFVLTALLVVVGFYHLEASVGSIVMLMEIVFAVIFAFFIYNETVAPVMVFGGALILAAVILPELPSLRTQLLKNSFRKKI